MSNVVNSGVGWHTQVPFGCSTSRLIGTVAVAVVAVPWQASCVRTDQAEAGAYPLAACLGLVLEREAVAWLVSGSAPEPVPAIGQLWPVSG